MNVSPAKKICYTALFACCICLSTWLISVPLPASGYFNVGDVFVLLSAWLLGPLYGACAAGIGAMLADLLAGYALYAPATLIVKAAVALVAYAVIFLFQKLSSKKGWCFFGIIVPLSAAIAETVMVLGYLFFEAVILSLGAGAFANLLGNATQGVCCAAIAVSVLLLLSKVPPLKKTFNIFSTH